MPLNFTPLLKYLRGALCVRVIGHASPFDIQDGLQGVLLVRVTAESDRIPCRGTPPSKSALPVKVSMELRQMAFNNFSSLFWTVYMVPMSQEPFRQALQRRRASP